MNWNDPARAHNRTVQEIRARGAVFNINHGIEIEEGKNCVTRLIGWPGNGTRMVSFHLLTHRLNGEYAMESHPISEESIICIRGRGEVNLGRGWVEVEAGNAIYVPAGLTHATRNAPGSAEDFVLLSYHCPPAMEYYEKIGLFKDGDYNHLAIDQAMLVAEPGNVPSECVMKANDLGGDERGEFKGAGEVSRTGGVFNIFRGAMFTGYGSPMRFLLWPGSGTRLIGQHVAFHDPGTAFKPHIHPISEDAILAIDGLGQGYLESRWIDVVPGDIIYAPAGVKHGTGNKSRDKVFIASGCASPPQFELYEKAGYLKDGKFVDFKWE